jgi:tripartite-type tricarboxylate transporter receptor subunit TctC
MASTFVRMARAAALMGVLTALPAPATAQYPDRPVKMIVPWAAGGDTDNIFRPFAAEFQKQLGQPVVIANVGGASGTVGAPRALQPTAIRSTRCTTTSI